MSPLALYIEQVAGHMPVSPFQHPKVTVYPPSPHNNQIFGSFHSAPTLDKTRINRVLVYPGSFNPPHRGHLHLLKHVFMRGAHDLNIITAIILPRSDESLAKKVREEDGKFMFGRDERCLLWKQDICFPPWAWVYEKSTTSFTTFVERLIQATKKDGYTLELVPLYGPGIGSPSNPPNTAFRCETMIMSDAARAAEFQLFSGRLRDFSGCTKWRRVLVDQEELRRHAKAKASHALQAMKTISPPETHSMLIDGPAYVEESTATTVAKAIEEMKAVLTCKRTLDDGRKITLRFVKCDEINSRRKHNDISSTIVRMVMRKQKGVKLREALDWMVLSADLLWQCRASWIDKARLGTGCCINFQLSTEDLLSLEEAPAYEEPPSSDDLPSREELELVKFVKSSPSVEELPLLEHPTSHDISPSFEEPQSLERPQMPEAPSNKNDKKRRFSATGLEAEIEVIRDSFGGGILAEDAEV